MKEIFRQYKLEIIFHLGAQPLVRLSYEIPVETYETNVIGSTNIMEAAHETNSVKNADGITEIRNCHINVGTGKEISIREVAELIMKEIGFQGKLRWDASKPDGTLKKLTDVSKLHQLGWHPK